MSRDTSGRDAIAINRAKLASTHHPRLTITIEVDVMPGCTVPRNVQDEIAAVVRNIGHGEMSGSSWPVITTGTIMSWEWLRRPAIEAG